MEYAENNVSDIQIAYIGGGSRGWAWSLMKDLAMEDHLNGTVRLYDIDEQSSKNNEIIGNRLTARQDTVGKWIYKTYTTLSDTLAGCDFVIISILPGTFDEMESDVHLPERLTIYQSVGDTAGPGGMIRALRTIPMFVTIAEAIKKYAPTAWVINYTNPMSLCVKTLYHVFPEIKAFGCCHEVFGTQKLLRDICQETFHFEEMNHRDIIVNVLGINHFTWFDQASYRGIDLFPVYKKYIEEHYEEGTAGVNNEWEHNTFASANRVKFDLFLRYGQIAAAGDRHLAEFMPGDQYLNDPDTVRSWKFGLTPVSWRKKDLMSRMAMSTRLIAGEEELKLEPSGEDGILLIKALCGLTRIISNVNLPNTLLQINNLPASAVVETNAVFSKDSVKPVCAGSLAENIRNLILPHIENHEDILTAAINCDRNLVIKAFLRDPLVKAKANGEAVTKLVEDMIANTYHYLPDGWMN